tara:strand:+ start:1737 stop:2420 length:684 start_codon:yes stop_codon:yes gene_type:complete
MDLKDLKTPRPLPDDIEEWSNEIESLLSEWAEVSMCYAYLHNISTRKYKKKYHHIQIPIIILSTLSGVGNFAGDSYVPVSHRSGYNAVIGGINIFCGILGTLGSFLRYSEIMEGHRLSGLAWSKLSRNIEIELSLHDKKRKPCRDFLKICRSEYDNLLEQSPNIDLDIIGGFNKKFNDSYPNVRKPIICNGLREIKPYKNEEDVDPTKLTLIPEEDQGEPEPEADLP